MGIGVQVTPSKPITPAKFGGCRRVYGNMRTESNTARKRTQEDYLHPRRDLSSAGLRCGAF